MRIPWQICASLVVLLGCPSFRTDRPMKYPGLQGRPNECDELDSEEESFRASAARSMLSTVGLSMQLLCSRSCFSVEC